MDYHQRIKSLVSNLKRQGITVTFTKPRTLQDYGGMNTNAAKAMGWPMRKHGLFNKEIYIDGSMSPRLQYETLRHESCELKLMDKGMNYHDAHLRALRFEKAYRR